MNLRNGSLYVFVRQAAVRASRALGVSDRVRNRLVRLDLAARERFRLLERGLRSGQIEHDGLMLTFSARHTDVPSSIITTGTYEADTLEVLRRVLSPGDSFIDLGAHIGFVTLHAARLVGPTGRVFAFEPSPDTSDILEHNVGVNGKSAQVEIVRAGVSGAVGTAKLLVDSDAQADSIASDLDALGLDSHVEVPVTTVDAFMASRGWPSIRLIKMDVEGQEYDTLGAMTETCARNPQLSLIVEYHAGQQYRAGVNAEQFLGRLSELGFSPPEIINLPNRPKLDGAHAAKRLAYLASCTNLNLHATRAR